jgi:hypothetical protein
MKLWENSGIFNENIDYNIVEKEMLLLIFGEELDKFFNICIIKT